MTKELESTTELTPPEKYEAKALVATIWLQVCVACGIVLLGMGLGSWIGAWSTSVIVYFVLAVWLDFLVVTQFVRFRLTHTKHPWRSHRFVFWWSVWGMLLLIVTPASALGVVLERSQIGLIWFYPVILLLVALLIAAPHALVLLLVEGRTPWLSVGAALVLTPLMVAWLAGSGAWWVRRSFVASPMVLVAQQLALRHPAARAKGRCPDASRWSIKGQPLRVAVSLSGGGYRAAVTHAGLLAALDEHCLPIHYLTTVSGGSIVGATYAFGIRPTEFALRLHSSPPGLANDILTIGGVYREWFDRTSSNAEVFRDHLRHIFFGDTTLADLPDSPVLLVNATDLEAESAEAREVFFKGRAPWARLPGGTTLDETTLVADVVAASGAFPGAFQPKRVRWIASDSINQVKERMFVDGGVLENLGVEGLRRYLTLKRPLETTMPERPHLLIISDASQRSDRKVFPPKVELLRLLTRTQSIVYDVLHRHLFARYTGNPTQWSSLVQSGEAPQVFSVDYRLLDKALEGETPQQLHTVVILVTGRETATVLESYSSCKFSPLQSAASIQREVAEFDTLKELSPQQVERGFWLGYVLGRIAWAAIDCGRSRVLTGDTKCPHNGQVRGDFTCPSFAEIITRGQ